MTKTLKRALRCVQAIAIGAGLAISAFTISSCSKAPVEAGRTEAAYKTISPRVLDTTYNKEYVAEIHSIQNVDLRTRVKGFIEKIKVDEGQTVHKRQVLFVISSQIFKVDLQKAEAQLKSAIALYKVAEVELANSKILVGNNIVSSTDQEMSQAKSDAIKAQIEEARSTIAMAHLNLSFTEVRAPFDGVINRILNKTGSLVGEGTLLTTISDNSQVYTYFNVSEKDYLNFVKDGQIIKDRSVTLMLANNQLYGNEGKIEIVENEIDRATGSLAIRAKFPNPDHVLKHGSSGKVRLATILKEAMVVPQKCTFEMQDKIFVYVVDTGNIVRMRSIVISQRLNQVYVVESGLLTQDHIIFEGIQQVKEGDKITVLQIDKGTVKAKNSTTSSAKR